MTADARTKIGALSGGQRRRVTWASPSSAGRRCCSSTSPPPALTPKPARRLWSVIENHTASSATVLLTTHYMDEAQHLASRVIVLADGRVIADAAPDRLRAMGGVPVIRYQAARVRTTSRPGWRNTWTRASCRCLRPT